MLSCEGNGHDYRIENSLDIYFLLSIICALTNINYLCNAIGGLAQLVRALAWHARGREFESHILHYQQCEYDWLPIVFFLLQSKLMCKHMHR